MKMKAAVLVKHGNAEEAFQLREIDRKAPGSGEVSVKVEAFGLNFADVMARKGLYREAPPLPSVLGYDLCGVVDQVGAGVNPDWIGKRVAGMSRFGAYAEYCVTNINGLTAVTSDLDPISATSLGTQCCTAYHAAFQATNIYHGERVLIHAAAGGVGSILVQLALNHGCEVFATAGSEEKLEKLRKMGVHHAVNYKSHDYESALLQILKGERIDAIFNAIAGSTFKKDQRLLGAGGRNIIYGAAERTGMKGGKFATLRMINRMGLLIPILRMAKSQSLVGVNMLKMGDYKPERIASALAACAQLMESGVISKQEDGLLFGIKDLAKAHRMLEERKTTGKIAIRWD
jgi:NADPH:quinone reductase-like Zn-dependent oxidoreductase